jgi:hypothetical protein
MVASLPSNGASPLTWFARAARTCCELSCASSRTQGIIRARMTSLSSNLAKPVRCHVLVYLNTVKLCLPGIWPDAAVRTSASLSLSN